MRLILALLLLLNGLAYGQQNNTTNTNFTNGLGASKFLNIPRGTVRPTTGVLPGSLFYHTTLGLQYWDGTTWQNIGQSDAIPGGPISSIPTVGYNPGTNLTPGEFIISAFYQSQAPTATLTGGQTLELHSAGTFSGTLNWSGSRQAATTNLTSIVVAGVAQSFTNPSAPGTVSGTQGVTVTWNSNVTYTNTVTSSDGKIGTATTSYTFLPGRYWGRSTGPPDNAAILAAAGGGTELSGSKSKTGFTITASGSNNVFYAYPSSLGVLTSITVGGFESFAAFTRTTVSVTNASGYTQDYYVYTSNDTYSATTPAINAQ